MTGAGPIRVLHLDGEPGYRGGQRQVALLTLAQAADPSGPRPFLLARSERLGRAAGEGGVPTWSWGNPATLAAARTLRRRLLEVRPDVLHAHDARAHGLARVVVATLPEAERPSLVVHRRIDDVPTSRAVTRWKYRDGTFVCVSEAVARVLRSAGVAPERLHVVRSGVPVPARPEPRAAANPTAPMRVLALGALVPHKGHDLLLEALARCRAPATLTLMGSGPERARLERLTRALGLVDRVGLAGDPGAEPPAWSEFDLFVQPSRTEGLGTAVIDAMAGGLPVLATTAGGLAELVIPRQAPVGSDRGPAVSGSGAQGPPTGWLVAAGSAEPLAAGLDAADLVRASDPEAFFALGLAGHARVAALLSVSAMVAGVHRVYDHVLGAREPRE